MEQGQIRQKFENYQDQEEEKPFYKNTNYIIYAVFVGIFLLFLVPILYSTFIKPIFSPDARSPLGPSGSPETLEPLPIIPDKDGEGISISDVPSEKLQFGHFYKKENKEFVPKYNDFELPINSKTEARNYYELQRRINLDPYFENVNEYGFSIVDKNEFGIDGKNFYEAYKALSDRKIHQAITNDFLLFYYQNVTRKAFKDIEQNVFYESLWDLTYEMHVLASRRYMMSLGERGQVNDRVLEAQRMEAAFFAVALKLLEPEEEQIMTDDDDPKTSKKFTKKEADKFTFKIPSVLRSGNTIEREVEMIKDKKKVVNIQKSPILFYYRDYSTFNVPKVYSEHAKLYNFYQALEWLNSLFPLYYISEDCPDCLLDYDDWRISIGAASFISKDFSSNQHLKDEWAKIYKFISYFRGLRWDLTYLDYDEVFKQMYNDDYNISEIFSKENETFDTEIKDFSDRLLSLYFPEIEGGVARTKDTYPNIGMRTLQNYFWPNDYIFGRLTDESINRSGDDIVGNAVTSCRGTHSAEQGRCRGFGWDILGILYNGDLQGDHYYTDNTNYNNYSETITEIKNELAAFGNFSWNRNIYWSNLDIARSYFSFDYEKKPSFMKNDEWITKIDFNTVLGGWVNLHKPEVDIVGKAERLGTSFLEEDFTCDFTCISINIDFLEELIAKNNMLIEAISGFKISPNVKGVSRRLTDLDNDLRKLREITLKEMRTASFSNDDCNLLKDLTVKEITDVPYNSSIKISNYSSVVDQKLKGVKFVLFLFENKENDKMLSMGPIFNYRE